MVNACLNDIDDARSRRQIPLADFILTEETSGSPSKLHDPRFYQTPTHLSGCSDIESAAPCARLQVVLKKVTEVTISKMFIICIQQTHLQQGEGHVER